RSVILAGPWGDPNGTVRRSGSTVCCEAGMASRSEIAREQEYFDRAGKAREESRINVDQAADAASHPAAAGPMRRDAQAYNEGVGGAETAVAFGRMDDDEGRLYVGRRLIRGDDGEVLVVNWHAPAAERFYLASHQEPYGLIRKRTFRCTGNVIDDFTELVF